mmetsp:Transcript_12011/g.33957  ORF Transcript_12011/g.33957 Transcript_12011/m.33957 type:complete len:126 (+) Transcript_12011:84-461(+)
MRMRMRMARSPSAAASRSGFCLRPCALSTPSMTRRNLNLRRGNLRTSKTREVTAMGIFGLGLPEVAVIAGVAVLLFGPSKMPELGKTLGKTVRELQDASKEFKDELDAELAKGPEEEDEGPTGGE